MKDYLKLGVAAGLGLATVALTASTASAAIVCNRRACWHVRHAYAYPPAAGLVVHPNGWRWGRRAHFVWREHRGHGRGYWRNGVWVTF